MKNFFKKIIFILVLNLIIGTLPMGVFAAEETIWTSFKLIGNNGSDVDITELDDLKYAELKFEGKVTSPTPLNFQCIALLTDNYGKIVKISQTPVQAMAEAETDIRCTLLLTDAEKNGIINGYKLKIFFWDSIDEQKSLKAHLTYSHGTIGNSINGVGVDVGTMHMDTNPIW